MRILNVTRDVVLAQQAERASTLIKRMVGLLGRSGLDNGEGLWIDATNSIHTMFMRFTIDAVFVDRDGTVVRTYEHLAPWRMTRFVANARAVVELPAGTIEKTGTKVADRLEIEA